MSKNINSEEQRAWRVAHGFKEYREMFVVSKEDQEFYELRDIATEARKRGDRRTLVLLGERIDEFYKRHPGYLYCCFSSSMTRDLYHIK